ncbi:fatty acid desaturase [Marivibrio halodurans]|uniref:Fatty acid desaturase n=1 Tax=Marivibrio halodurans TaxID=2039722 RepID=A0A8J7UZJ0_9PROT|nr:fatty acid desaturase [Marivibrio halodurans]
MLLTYGGFLVLTYWWRIVPLPLLVALGAYLVCLHGHMAHELLHGHPTRKRWLNDALAMVPLSLWLPYPIYRDSHLAHHGITHLTSPIEDPESFYLTPKRWSRKPVALRALLYWNQSFLGRMAVGPLLMVGRFLAGEIRRFGRGEWAYAGAWAVHLMLAALVVFWVVAICGMPFWLYLVGIVYPGLSLGLMRSYVEHRPGPDQDSRCAIVEGGPLTRLLFLNNNFHLVHHVRPGLPWYRIPAVYRADKAGWLARNGGYRYRGYWDVIGRHLLWAKDSPLHPTIR